MAHAEHASDKRVLLPARQPAAVLRVDLAVHPDGGRRRDAERRRDRRLGAGLGFVAPVHALLPLVRRGDPREPGRALQRAGRPLVPHGHDVVHLLRGHVLRRFLRRAVLRAAALRAVARRRGCQGSDVTTMARTSRPAGRATARATSARATTAATRSSPPSACRRSTPRCCSPRASRSRSRTTP